MTHISDSRSNPTKVCVSCLATLPTSWFGVNRLFKDGLYKICRRCRSDHAKLERARFKGVSHNLPTRILRFHNRQILSLVLSGQLSKFYGFVPQSDVVYRFDYGVSRYGVPSLAYFSEDGSVYRELAFSGDQATVSSQIESLLVEQRIRLELTELDVIRSKTEIYYL